MVYSNTRAQYPNHGSGSLFSKSNSSLSSVCSTVSYNMSSLTSTPASSTSSLSLPYLDQSNNNKTLPALPLGVDSSFLQQQQLQQQQRFSSFQQHGGFPSSSSSSTTRPTSYKITASSRKQTTTDSKKADTPKKIPRPPNSFMIYRREQAALHRGLMASQLSMILGKKWEAEPAERKAHFTRLARLAQEEHARRYPEYKFMPARRGTGKKAQMLAARKATASGCAEGYFASPSSTSMYPISLSQPASLSSLVPFTSAMENNGRPLPVLPLHPETQTQFISASRQRVAPFNYSASTPHSTTHSLAFAPLPSHDLPNSLLFDSFGASVPQNTILALYNNPSPFTPPDTLPFGNSPAPEPQPPCTQIPFSSSLPGVSTPPVPCPPLTPSSLLLPTSPLSYPFDESDILALSWGAGSQFEGTPPTQTAASQAYIAEAFKSTPGQSPIQTTYDSLQSAMPAYSFRPASAAAMLSPSSSLTTLASPIWASGPLSSGIMMENGSVQSPTLPYCSSLSTSASSSFSELSPFLLLNTPLNDPTFLAGQEKECFFTPSFPLLE